MVSFCELSSEGAYQRLKVAVAIALTPPSRERTIPACSACPVLLLPREVKGYSEACRCFFFFSKAISRIGERQVKIKVTCQRARLLIVCPGLSPPK
jgi:hypothetical protein